jgi:argininosuccinate lyase
MNKIIANMKFNKEKTKSNYSKEIFAADLANEMVLEGTPFRKAYKKVSMKLNEITEQDLEKNLKKKKLIGGTGNLGLKKLKKETEKKLKEIKKN